MFPRFSLFLLICCWWQWGSLLILAPRVCLANEDYYENNVEPSDEEQYYDEDNQDHYQDNNDNQVHHDHRQHEHTQDYQEEQNNDHSAEEQHDAGRVEEHHHHQEDSSESNQYTHPEEHSENIPDETRDETEEEYYEEEFYEPPTADQETYDVNNERPPEYEQPAQNINDYPADSEPKEGETQPDETQQYYPIATHFKEKADQIKDEYNHPPTQEDYPDDEPTYNGHADEVPGVDWSWPMHASMNRHPDHNEFLRRLRRHGHFMQGCISYYSQAECEAGDSERMQMNLRQPRNLQNYTAAGYAKVQAPAGVFSMLKDFYDQHHGQRQVRENWPPGNIYTNHWASVVKMLPISGLPQTKGQAEVQPSLSQQQRRDIISQVQPILEAWVKMPLIPTSLYGIRIYKRGSVLAPHVDRLPLVISAIINVAQEVKEDWPLEVIDHSGKAVNVTMKPGEMVLYEGASVIHGRPYPLHGQTYSNVFLHFEPVGYSERYHNSADQKRKRKDPKDLFEEVLAKQQKKHYRNYDSDQWKGKLERPYYVPVKNDEQWEQRFVYVKKTSPKKPKAKTTTTNDSHGDVEERLFHNLAAKGMLLKMKEMVMEDPAVIAKTDSNGWLALHEAARAGHTHVVLYLCTLMDQAEINTRTNGGKGATPLWWAMHMFNKDHPTVKALIKHGGKSIAPNA